MTDRVLDYFRQHANSEGLAMAKESRLIQELDGSRDNLALALDQLETQGKVRILSRMPFVALKLVPWSGSSSSDGENQQQISSHSASVHLEVPVSSSNAAAATHTEDGGAGEGDRLLGEVLAALGPDADRDEFARLIAGKTPALIRRCLERVRATQTIRVSRAALFRHLLRKLAS